MYVPRHYASPGPEHDLRIIEASPMATMISVVDGDPFVSYAPFIIERSKPDLVLAAHLARANPHTQHLDGRKVLVLFRGVDGYISPRFSQDCRVNVPSWNYIAVHCTGVARIMDEGATASMLRTLTDRMEAGAPDAWRVDDLDRSRMTSLMKAIVAFSVHVTEMTAKFKLSQRGSDGDVARLIAGLRGSGRQSDRLLADEMEAARG